uniref:Secreted protein n=1 Tax=Macrostomum lignano TaxID=282301 RepID=A0A1I8JLV7_9PLAT
MKCPVPKLVLPLLLSPCGARAEGRSASGAAVEAAEAEGAARLSDQQWADDEEALLLSLLRQRAAAQAEKRGFRNSLRFGSNYGSFAIMSHLCPPSLLRNDAQQHASMEKIVKSNVFSRIEEGKIRIIGN